MAAFYEGHDAAGPAEVLRRNAVVSDIIQQCELLMDFGCICETRHHWHPRLVWKKECKIKVNTRSEFSIEFRSEFWSEFSVDFFIKYATQK